MNNDKNSETKKNTPGQKNTEKGTSGRGFASMDQDRQKEIASKGGKAAHLSGNAHQFTSEEAREAGRKGGQSTQNSEANFSQKRAIDADLNPRKTNVDDEDGYLNEENSSRTRSTDNSKY